MRWTIGRGAGLRGGTWGEGVGYEVDRREKGGARGRSMGLGVGHGGGAWGEGQVSRGRSMG